jgi:hypothetical protein
MLALSVHPTDMPFSCRCTSAMYVGYVNAYGFILTTALITLELHNKYNLARAGG